MSSKKQEENATSEVEQAEQSEIWSRFSVALHLLLPVAGLAIFLRQKHILSRLFLQLDRKCVSVFCPSFSQREKLLKWASSRLPQTWSSQSRTLAGGIPELWTDGSLLCTLINSAIPGACLNPHRHWKKPPLHAQAIAYKYLGIVPIFTEQDLMGELSVVLEGKFLQYLTDIQQAILKVSERNDLNKTTSTLYLARGMGLYTGEQHRKTVFYIYPNTLPTICNNTSIIIHIRGPYATYGKAIIPKFHKDLFTTDETVLSPELIQTKKILQNSIAAKNNPYMKNFSLPFMHYHKKHMGDNIVIHITMEDDRAKVTYIPKNYGMYEIIMIANGELIAGCPFNVHVLNNTSGIQETLENEEKEEIIPHARKRKVISKTIDFIDEQMPIADLHKRYKYTLGNTNNSFRNKDSQGFVKKDGSSNDKTKLNIEKDNATLTFRTNDEKETAAQNMEEKNIVEEKEYVQLLQENVNTDTIDSCSNAEEDSINDAPRMLKEQSLEVINENEASELQDISNEITSDNSTYEHMEHKDDINDNISEKTNEESVEDEVIPEQNNPISESKLTFNEYPKPIMVNRIQIPEKFTALQFVSSEEELSNKYVKNTLSKRSTILHEEDVKRITKTVQNYPMLEPKIVYNHNDDNDSGHDTISSLEDNEVRQNLIRALSRERFPGDLDKVNTVPRGFFDAQEAPRGDATHTHSKNPTSPICSDPIVPEVQSDFKFTSVAEKRKIFTEQTKFQPTNNSFPELENATIRESSKHFQQYENLSVLSYLGSLKQTIKDTRESSNLCSTKSLPNMPSLEDGYNFHNTVKGRKLFWEKLSSSSASLNTKPIATKSRKLTEEERLRLIWKKPDESETQMDKTHSEDKTKIEESSELSKSTGNILSDTNFIPHKGPKKYKSLDDCLDDCTLVPIEERKKMLLRQDYEKEAIDRRIEGNHRKNNIKTNHRNIVCTKNNEDERIENKIDDVEVFTPIAEKLKIYASACNLTNNNSEECTIKKNSDNQTKTINISESLINTEKGHQEVSKSEKSILKSHFKKAIRYFKDLEDKSLGRAKVKSKKIDSRRHSFDIPTSNYKSRRKGGSLTTPKISDRFFINGLYKDVFGNRRSSFKGAPNRSALVEALATFSRNEIALTEDSDNDIKYDIFRKRPKSKKRKSLRSIFDVYY